MVNKLAAGIPTPLKNNGVKVSWDDEIPNWMENHKIPWFQSPPTSDWCFLIPYFSNLSKDPQNHAKIPQMKPRFTKTITAWEDFFDKKRRMQHISILVLSGLQQCNGFFPRPWHSLDIHILSLQVAGAQAWSLRCSQAGNATGQYMGYPKPRPPILEYSLSIYLSKLYYIILLILYYIILHYIILYYIILYYIILYCIK